MSGNEAKRLSFQHNFRLNRGNSVGFAPQSLRFGQGHSSIESNAEVILAIFHAVIRIGFLQRIQRMFPIRIDFRKGDQIRRFFLNQVKKTLGVFIVGVNVPPKNPNFGLPYAPRLRIGF